MGTRKQLFLRSLREINIETNTKSFDKIKIWRVIEDYVVNQIIN